MHVFMSYMCVNKKNCILRYVMINGWGGSRGNCLDFCCSQM